MMRNMPYMNSEEEVIAMFKEIQAAFRLNSQANDQKEQIVEINKLIRGLTKLKKNL